MSEGRSAVNRPLLRFLSDDKVRQIHGRSLDMLEQIGATVMREDGLATLSDAGATVDPDTQNARTPDLVERCVASAPERSAADD